MPSIGIRNNIARIGSKLNQNEPEVDTYISGLSTPLSAAQITRLNTFVSSLKTGLSISALSDAFDVMYLLAGETAESSLRNLVKNAHYAQAVNSPTWTQYQGYAGDGATSYIQTNYNPKTEGIKYAVSDASVGIYCNTNVIPGINFYAAIGTRTTPGTNRTRLYLRTPSDTIFGYINTDAGLGDATNTDSRGLYVITRTLNNESRLYKNKNLIYTRNDNSADVANLKFKIGVNDTNGTFESFSPNQHSFMFAGKGLTTAEIELIYDAFYAFFLT